MRKFLYFFLIFTSLIVHANEELAGRLIVDDSQKEISLGETFQAELQLWSREKIGSLSKVDFLSTKLLGLFFVADVMSIEPSINNQDLWVIRMLLVSARPFSQKDFYLLEINNRRIPISLENVPVVKNDGLEPSKELVFIKDPWPSKWAKRFWIMAISLVLIFLGLVIYKIIMRKRAKEAHKARQLLMLEEKMKWRERFLSAKAREDFEFIYKKKDDWKDYTAHQGASLDSFLGCVDRIQYKRDWSDEDLFEVSQLFDEIREIIE